MSGEKIQNTNFALFGTPLFAEIVLDKLIQAGYIPSVVVCNPDRPVGRKKIVTPPSVKARITNYESGIRSKMQILQPEKLDPSLFKIPNSLFDFFVVAAYAKIIPKEILDIPRLGTIGVHPSLLPKYRGASPIQSAILNGGEETGVTLYLMDEKMDHGPVLETRKWKIESRMDYTGLLKELAELGGEMLIETLPRFLAGEIEPMPQNHEEATFTKKFKTEDGFVSEKDLQAALGGDTERAIRIDRMIRALNPEPGSYTLVGGKRVKLLESKINEGGLMLKKIQFEGKKPTDQVFGVGF